MQMVYQAIKALVQYGLEKGLLTEDDAIYARNQILEWMNKKSRKEKENLQERIWRRSLRCFLIMQLKKGFYRKTVLYTEIFLTQN